MSPNTALVHHRRNAMRPGQKSKVLLIHEIQDQLMRWFLGLETLLDTDQKIFGTFPGGLKSHSKYFERLGPVHVFTCWNCSTCPSISSALGKPDCHFVFTTI